MPPTWLFVVTFWVALAALLYNPLKQRATTIGVFRKDMVNMHGLQMKIVPNTLQCEDLHYHWQSNLLFTACQTDDPVNRRKWYPPLGHFDESGVGQGTLAIIDTETLESKHLILKGFEGPFVTHGIDIFYATGDPFYITVFAVNHLPHPDAALPTQVEKARSQIEVFRHRIGDDFAQHIRSIRHPLLTTPNDIYATSSTSFYVTNDHYYRDGPLRKIEDFATRATAPWSNTVHVSFSDAETSNATEGVKATIALTGLHNNNGMGHATEDRPELVLIGDAAGGELTIATRNLAPNPKVPDDLKLKVLEHIQLDSTIDNPSYFDDWTATSTSNATGIIVAGLSRAVDLADSIPAPGKPIPVLVWYLKNQPDGTWEKKVIFQDDGNIIGGAATAVLVAIDPQENEWKKQGYLFVTGFLSDSMVAVKMDL